MREQRQGNLILVADDNEFIRYIIKKWLGTDAEIIEAANGESVVETYLNKKPDIVFLDIHMPGKNGKTILKEIREADPYSFIVMVSGDSKKENVVYTMMRGAKAFMTKPFTKATLERYYAMCPTITVKQADFLEIAEKSLAEATVPAS